MPHTRFPAAAHRSVPHGFTLLEVMVVIAIIAILTAFAVPSYTDSVTRSHRSEARSTLVQAAQFMERVRTERNSYAPGGAAPALPANLAQVPATGPARYTLAVGGATATTYTLTATPVGAMAGDGCGNLSIDNTGLRSHTGSKTHAYCWER